MAVQVDSTIAGLAQYASQITGLNQQVILAQWMSEEPIDQPPEKAWPGFNPAGITSGNPQVDSFAVKDKNGKIRKTSGGFNVFPDSTTGAEAYADLIETDPSYAGIREAIKSNDPQKELQAIADSPWDGGHYGGDGHKLFQNYNSLTGYNLKASPIVTSPLQNKEVANATKNNLLQSLGLPENGYDLLIVVVGVLLIAVLLYRIVTK